MPTLEHQLENNRKEEMQFQLANPKLERLESFISGAAVIAGFLSFFIVVAIGYLVFGVLLPEKSDLAGILILVFFYGGIYLAVVGQGWLEKPLQKLVHFFFGISKTNYEKNISARSDIRNRKWDIEKQIRDRDAKIQKEIKEEQERKLRQIYKEKEYVFISELNSAVYKIELQLLSYDDATILYKKLLDEYATIKFLYYHSSVYYRNRFLKITSALSRYGSTTTNPIPGTRTIKLAVNKAVSDDNTEPITKAETPPIDKPVEKNVLPVNSEKPIVDSAEPVNPFSPAYKPVVQTKPPYSPLYKPVENVETPKKEKPIITADISVIKENAANTTETSVEEVYSSAEAEKAIKRQRLITESYKVDYKALYEKRQHIGSVGETWVFEWEKRKLLRKGLSIDSLEHVSLRNDTLGYDIVSINEDGSPRYIEVKTTVGKPETAFFMSENERDAMKNLKDYFIYRLHNFDIEKGTGGILILDKKKGDEFLNFQPVSYRVTPK